MKFDFWQPLKYASLCYFLADWGLILGGVVYINWLVTFSGACGILGNFSLLIGGSGNKKIDTAWMRAIAPYSERLAMALYFLQNIAFMLSGYLMYHTVLWGELLTGIIGGAGCLVAIFWPKDGIDRVWLPRSLNKIEPYKLAGIMWLGSSTTLLIGGIESGNIAIVSAAILMLMSAGFIALSHRAEFDD